MLHSLRRGRPGPHRLAVLGLGLAAAACVPATGPGTRPGDAADDAPATVGAYQPPPPSAPAAQAAPEPFCPEGIDAAWRRAQTVQGVAMQASPVCEPDDPFFIAAVVKGTNNLNMFGLMKTRLAMDAVVKDNDRDGDGDPDDIHIRLEVVELNGRSPEFAELMNAYPIAPGIRPGFWAFAPKTRGAATASVDSFDTSPLLRLPSPTIRVEQGDHVLITLENSHYFPHTIHLHGVDHPYLQADGDGNEGVPQTSGPMVMPGEAFTYEITPRQPGTMAYHCHVQTGTHSLMGLFGMFVVEENRPNNWLQTLNVGAGQVRHPSVAVLEEYAAEYDMVYGNADAELNGLIQQYNDPRLTAQAMNRVYRLNERVPDYFLLNGRSFPYTLRDALVVARPDQHLKLRVLNAGSGEVALHTHGHKVTITHYDGVPAPAGARITRDVVTLATAQRLDLDLNTTNDGLHNYGEGVWLFHDHHEQGITTNGMMPGGDLSAIVYESFLGENGMPRTQGMDLSPYFTDAYYRGEVPVWQSADPTGRWTPPAAAGE